MAKGQGVIVPEEIVKLLNYRIEQEELSSRLYLSMSEWLTNQGYDGAAKMIHSWYEEEAEHAVWAREFLRSYNFLPEVRTIAAPTLSFSSLKDVIKKSLEHEIEITSQCNELATKVNDVGCYCAMPLALKYIQEQADEIDKTTGWLDRLDLAGDDMAAILQIDAEMGA